MAAGTYRQGHRIKITVLIAATVLLFSSVAAAQTSAPGSPGQPLPRLERPDNRTPAARQAENYDPLGVRLGGFLLFPSLEVGEAYNDNVFAVSSGSGPVASFLQIISPAIELRSTWSSDMLNFYARGNIGFYTAAPAQNYQDFSVGVDGRIDIQRNWNTYGSLSFNRLHENPGLPNTVSGSSNVTLYNQATGSLGYYQKFTRFSARVDLRADNFSYLNNGLGPAQGVVPNFDRDRTDLR